MSPHAWWAESSAALWPALVNHLWQASLFALLVFAAALLLRRAPASTRHVLWLVALAKFAVPPAAVMLLVPALPPSRSAEAQPGPAFPPVLARIAEPVAPVPGFRPGHNEGYCALSAIWLAGTLSALALWWRRRRRFILAAGPLTRVAHGREWEVLERMRLRLGLRRPVRLLAAAGACEPAAWGVWRPAILIPAGLADRLGERELEAVLLHELLHVKRGDNLAASLQALVCAVFWFHPLVWWIDRRILAERERACDEQVVGLLGEAGDYAASILKTCEFGLASPAAGISAAGSDLKRRVERIMTQQRFLAVAPRRAAVAAVASAAVAISVLAGWLAGPARAQAQAAPYVKWLEEDVAYLITEGEKAAFLKLSSDEEREQFIEQFWLRRDASPGTPAHEVKEEHYRRIGYANARFGASGEAGWRTPRGRIYIIFGPPDEIESHPSRNMERWRYREGTLAGMVLEFSTQ
ncbi:MAG: M56 family metallopeptidase [Acidobacteriota bacterium]